MNVTTATTPPVFDLEVDTLIVGAGACGLVAALSAREAGQSVLVLEADAVPSGSTALSAGLIPAAGTHLQQKAGIKDSAQQFFNDVQAKAKGENNEAVVAALTKDAHTVIGWLMRQYQLPFTLVDDFDYPGHSRRRMHGLPARSGAELIDALRSACEAENIDIACNRRAYTLYGEKLDITGVGVVTSTGESESIGCKKLILACNGFGGNRRMVQQHLPDIANGVWFGHNGNQGEAMLWGDKLGAKLSHMSAYQGHGNVAHPHGILITWAVITQGGIQVNRNGCRFWDESQGYSEAARAVLSQLGGEAITIFDKRIASVARQFEDFKQAEISGAVKQADSVAELAALFSLPTQALLDTVQRLSMDGDDEFGRTFTGSVLTAPFYAVKVTGALFHTQGGLEVNECGRVIHQSGELFSNLYAGGGAACGVSGNGDSGYLSGNGLLSAVVLGFNAGKDEVVS